MSTNVLDYTDIYQEVRGALHEGRLRLTSSNVVFKDIKNGKVETVPISSIDDAVWRRVARGYELKLCLNDGRSLKFDGFKESEYDRLNKHVKNHFNISLEQQDLCAKGWNWGEASFKGYELRFDVDNKRAFEIPLQNVSQCTPGKNEASLEFHQNDDAELSLMEMRFFVPPASSNDVEATLVDTVQVFCDNVVSKADVLQAKGNAICVFQDLQCLTPRGRYDIRMYPKFVQLHGKTFDYKITYTSILRLFLLPHRDQRQIFFVVSLDPPVRQGQTRYHFLVLLFYKEDEMSVEMTLSEEEIEQKFGDRLQKDMSGPIYDVVSKVMKNLVQRKITVPGSFKGVSNEQSIMCTYKASSGFLFPLERGFMYVHKPPIHVRFDEIAYVNFARGSAASSRSFDFEIETRSQTSYVFSNIEKNCYPSLFDFVKQKKLKIKNIERGGDGGANMDFMANSDSEDEQHDAYLERMKQEAADRDEDGGGDDSNDSSEDEDFNPGEEPQGEVRDEYDSDAVSTSDEDGNSGPGSEEEKKPKKKKEKKREKKSEKHREKESKKKRSKKDANAPKRPTSAYMKWFADNRSKIKNDNPEFSMTDIAKEAGRLWKDVTESEKEVYNRRYEKEKVKYAEEMKQYKASDGYAKPSSPRPSKPSKPSTSKPKVVKSPAKASVFKSKEFIQDSGSSSDSDDDGAPVAKVRKEETPVKKEKASESEAGGSESEAQSTPASSDDSD